MGGGGHKTHESFTVTPSAIAALPPPAAGGQAPDAGGLVADLDPAGVFDDAATEESAEPPVEVTSPNPPAVPAADDALTPIPSELTPGDPAGTHLLVGGADLVDSTVTLMSYKHSGGPREMLVATVEEEAEAKLLEALAVSDTKMVPVEVQTEAAGRLPLDTEHQLHEQLAVVAKSVNHHLKAGDGIPPHTLANLQKVTAQLHSLSAATTAEGDQAMLAHYQADAAGLAERTAPGWTTPYDQGGKMPQVDPYETTGLVTVTKYIPAPAEQPGEGQLAATLRDATRPKPAMNPEGTVTWNGNTRDKAAAGKEYLVELGDGYQAVYRPYAANDPAKSEYSQRGTLEIVAPPGAGHAAEMVHRLGQLNLVNRPMTAAEGEWAYLRRNVWAQQLENHPAVKSALVEADGLDDAVEHVLFAQHAHEAIGLDDSGLARLAKQIRLDAEAKALPEKVRFLRDGMATACGYSDGQALSASPGYQPTPRSTRAGLSWERFDVTNKPGALSGLFAHKGLTHSLGHGNIVDVFRSGVLASTERRALMGIPKGKGMSEDADKLTGGANSVFLRVCSKPKHGPCLYWDDPTGLLDRADWYAYNGDHFGALNPKSGHSTSGQTRDPAKLAAFSGNNEVMIRHGLDLLGAEAPSLIRCANATQRKEVLDVLNAKGITHLRGRPVADVVK